MSVLRSIPSLMTGAAVESVDHRLDQIAADSGARILLAVESGSRAWGFPSPDSDYDCRFIYTRSPDDYLTPWVPRDVIETPIEGELDVNGWDLAKALKLLVKGNAVVVEWLTSPIVYRGDQRFKNDLLAFAGTCLDRQMVARHYLHLGLRQRRLHFTDQADVALKKVFYALRPAAVLRWLRLNPEAAIAPMHFPTLMAQCAPPREVSDIVDELLARKAVTRRARHVDPADADRPLHRRGVQRRRQCIRRRTDTADGRDSRGRDRAVSHLGEISDRPRKLAQDVEGGRFRTSNPFR